MKKKIICLVSTAVLSMAGGMVIGMIKEKMKINNEMMMYLKNLKDL